MLLAPDKATERLSSERNLANRFSRGTFNSFPVDEAIRTPSNVTVTSIQNKGKPMGTKHLSSVETTTIALLTRSGEKQKDVAEIFGISRSTATKIENGRNKSIDEELVERKLGTIRDTALEKLTASLLGITDDKLAACDAKELSGIATNMGKVVESTFSSRDRSSDSNGAKVEVHIYAPETRKESLYPVQEV